MNDSIRDKYRLALILGFQIPELYYRLFIDSLKAIDTGFLYIKKTLSAMDTDTYFDFERIEREIKKGPYTSIACMLDEVSEIKKQMHVKNQPDSSIIYRYILLGERLMTCLRLCDFVKLKSLYHSDKYHPVLNYLGEVECSFITINNWFTDNLLSEDYFLKDGVAQIIKAYLCISKEQVKNEYELEDGKFVIDVDLYKADYDCINELHNQVKNTCRKIIN